MQVTPHASNIFCIFMGYVDLEGEGAREFALLLLVPCFFFSAIPFQFERPIEHCDHIVYTGKDGNESKVCGKSIQA